MLVAARPTGARRFSQLERDASANGSATLSQLEREASAERPDGAQTVKSASSDNETMTCRSGKVHLRARVIALACAGVFCAGRAAAQSPHSLAPAGWKDGLALAEAEDRNPDPKIVEIDLTARIAEVEVAPGVKVQAWTYDGHLPGPLVHTHVGDRVIVHFTNDLPQPTTIHWHGVRVPIEMDGVPDISQPAVKRGETFTYDFIARDAGLYWYHPHVMSAGQVGFGLYGALLVEDPDDGIDVADQLTVVLSDIGFDRKGVLDSPDTGGPAGMVFGREGAYVLANGKVMPTLRARSGAPQRWRIVNAAKSRFFMLDLDDQPFYVIGADGGLQEEAQTKTALLITPGERADVVVTPTGPPGGTLTLRANLYDRGHGSIQYRNAEDVLTIAFTNEPTLHGPTMPGCTATSRCRASRARRGSTWCSHCRRPALMENPSSRSTVPRSGKRSRSSRSSARPKSGRSGTKASSPTRSIFTVSSSCPSTAISSITPRVA